ncbi:hypothetical protein Y032_0402g810 [Ancylostoma ceylanicum]|uniref:Uncharacterized protein n=1 Tax=Ancylostoma ceylanicum TaxID=53326 RepID=A0A016X4X1_9BILA|nr:hypothetical protein Y032_0402g810 [Ancylostoma ceylanicum]
MSSDYTVVCTINKSQPAYQPNVYLCKTKSYCCTSSGQPVCCHSEISIQNVFLQTYPIVLLFLSFMLVALVVKWYFSDDDPPADIEKESSGKNSMMVHFYPTGVDDSVDDPLFGRVYEERVSKKAYVSKKKAESPETLRRRKSTYPIED